MFSELPLSKVTLIDPLYVKARDAELGFIRRIDADRVLCGFRRTVGIDTGDVRPYGGWEDSLIAGHCLGHFSLRFG